MSNTTKVTKRETLSAMLADDYIASNPTFKAFCEHEIELLDKKKESKTATKTQIENEEIKELILDLMTIGVNYTCTQIMKALDDDRVTSQQKTSSLMNALAKEGKVNKIVDKKSTFFAKV